MAKKNEGNNYQNFFQLALVLMVAFGLLATLVAAGNVQSLVSKAAKDNAAKTTGNGAPNGPHYNLNLIGVSKEKTADMTGDNGRRIFVPLEGKAKVMLSEAPEEESFKVLDANGTDGRAEFQLPNPDPDNDGVTSYQVWARALGKPGGKSTTTTCALDEYGAEWCSVESMVMVREKGKSSFTDVSKQLLYVYVDMNMDGSLERYPLFDPTLQDYFWSYDNNGLKLVQLRFYEQVSSDVN